MKDGGIVIKATAAILLDGGPETIIPLSELVALVKRRVGVHVQISNGWNPYRCKLYVDGVMPHLLYRYSIKGDILKLDMFKPSPHGNPYTLTPDDPRPQLLTEYYPIASLEIDSGRFGE